MVTSDIKLIHTLASKEWNSLIELEEPVDILDHNFHSGILDYMFYSFSEVNNACLKFVKLKSLTVLEYSLEGKLNIK